MADCFSGQPKTSGVQYRVDPGRVEAGAPEQQDFIDDAGFKNSEIVLSPLHLLENIQTVQRRQNLSLSAEMVVTKVCPVNLDIEMETGTGKTWCFVHLVLANLAKVTFIQLLAADFGARSRLISENSQ